MSIAYRLLHSDEEDQAIAFWMRVLETNEEEARQTFRNFRDAPERFKQTHVAVAADGRLLATVCYWLREVRGQDGMAVPVAHIFHVATEPSARRQGHATRLLTDAVKAVGKIGCQWAILSARQNAVSLYERAGWQAVPRSYWRGTCQGEFEQRQGYAVDHYDLRQEKHGWTAIAAHYERATIHQSGSLIRTAAYWSGYGAWMFGLYLDSYGAILLTVRDETDGTCVRGYALVNFYETGFVVSEIVADPDDPDVLSSLLSGIIREAQQRGVPLAGQLTIAVTPVAEAVLTQFFSSTLHRVDDSALYGHTPFMVRPIGDATNSPFAASSSLFRPLDAY